ncbi:lipid-binding SYLF domain-containing protein [Nitratiruptor sp. YY09-18]|uniref:lipid-binding SYLF domain-containing protein n=1 Tax=Nitratiruptor sp. YY09-18 TaxID=2724901 RepID=UPI001916BF56|nr:lipid-binding SYLF domain-containing protein [Nitratiruptor sp. YY09-18]BCD68837.1 hypothetical protein NitYY0918_C1756 [Nitratiruptor sp. YY09-18]
MKKIVLLFLTTVWLFGASPQQILEDSFYALQDFVHISEKKIPHKLLHQAKAVLIVPNLLRGAFIVGGRYGEGILLVRNSHGWSDPVFIKVYGGSFGWQIGVESIDVVLVFRSPRSLKKLLRGRFTLGVDGSLAIGPVGRAANAATDLTLSAEIYSYSRSRGAFAGVSLNGAVLDIDKKATSRFYKTSLNAVLQGRVHKHDRTIAKIKRLLSRF